jgi:hypothetical protein
MVEVMDSLGKLMALLVDFWISPPMQMLPIKLLAKESRELSQGEEEISRSRAWCQ